MVFVMLNAVKHLALYPQNQMFHYVQHDSNSISYLATSTYSKIPVGLHSGIIWYFNYPLLVHQ